MKDLKERILELINEEGENDETPSFSGDESSDTKNSDTETTSDDSSENTSDDNSSDGPSFSGDESSDDTSNDDNSSKENNNDDSSDDSKDNDEKKDEDDKKEEFKAESFEDFLTKTESKMKITKISSEPSTIFGNNDIKNHNKYKVTISNEKGSVWFYFWDSIYNTENNKKPSQDDILACFGMDVGSVMDGVSKDEFAEVSGYDKSEDSLA